MPNAGRSKCQIAFRSWLRHEARIGHEGFTDRRETVESRYPDSAQHVWGVAKLVRHRPLEPAFPGSSPGAPANTSPELRCAPLRLPPREPPPSLRSGDYSRGERMFPVGGRIVGAASAGDGRREQGLSRPPPVRLPRCHPERSEGSALVIRCGQSSTTGLPSPSSRMIPKPRRSRRVADVSVGGRIVGAPSACGGRRARGLSQLRPCASPVVILSGAKDPPW